jgi:type IV pilus assembly protein PilY1
MNKLILNMVATIALLLSVPGVFADILKLATQPLFTATAATPMMMLVMGRDHTLYYEAYNDASDLDGDGDLDIKFKPTYSYEGYFDPQKCYNYDSNLFSPVKVSATCTSDTTGKWSGNFLNYLTMTRMDVIRKVLYGGTRSTDTTDKTILERVFIPQDAHSWGKAYISKDIDGYDIRDYAPLPLPDKNKQHFFGSATFSKTNNPPTLRVRKNVGVSGEQGIWSWASTERPVLKATGTDYTVRVAVCVTGLLESDDSCKEYSNGTFKPTGLLHDYGDDDQMLFGLLTGSYNNNLSGGVLRKVISEFSEEVDDNGIYVSGKNGIIDTINKLRIHGFNYSRQKYDKNCGWVVTGPISNGQCASWGNPIGEMLYESLRYFSGAKSPSSTYNTTGGFDENDLGLPNATWDDPFETGDASRICSNVTNLVISDINPSYDSDQLPGANSKFAKSYNGSILNNDFDLSALLNTISITEGKTSGNYFIGEVSESTTDTAPSVKAIKGLGNVRGLAPAEPTKEGSFSSAGVAYYGKTNDISSQKDNQNITTMVVALASALPEVTVIVNDKEIKIVPFAKSVGGGGISTAKSGFKPTNSIVDWYVQEVSDTKGVFRINFEDVEQGADHDMDMVVKYTYEVKPLCLEYKEGKNATYGQNDNKIDCKDEKLLEGVQITLDSTYAAGGIDQHAGYIISGTTKDDLYLEVKDRNGANRQYHLDTPSANLYSNRNDNNSKADLPLTRTRNFFPSNSIAADFLPSPLWYAAKWGGFNDDNEAGDSGYGIPDTASEWDSDNNGVNDGVPETYFPVTNAGELKLQLTSAFSVASAQSRSGTAAAFNGNILQQGTLQYRSYFESEYWSGDIKAYEASAGLNFDTLTAAKWSAAKELDDKDYTTRKIFSRKSAKGPTFDFNDTLPGSYSTNQLKNLLSDYAGTTEKQLTYLKATVNYIRGDRTHENNESLYPMRKRGSVLGSIVHSTPYYVAPSNGHDVEKELLVFGANDGMVHILDAKTGEELMAYIPSGVYEKLKELVKPSYIHKYSVDGGIAAYTVGNKTTLVGTLGTGKKGLYAIDVSDMTAPTNSMLEWEIKTGRKDGGIKEYNDLGLTGAAPTIMKLANGEVGVIFANGYNSKSDQATIYIANINDGSLIKKLTTGTIIDPTGNNRPNAMASPAVLDTTGDKVADYIYAGDLYGNMWVFDVRDELPENWGNKKLDSLMNPSPLFTTSSPTRNTGDTAYLPQPITTKPQLSYRKTIGTVGQVGYVPSHTLVVFGTGQYIEIDDNNSVDQATQSFYVIKDQLSTVILDSARTPANSDKYSPLLLQQEILNEESSKRHLSDNKIDWSIHSGFYLDLVDTEDGTMNNFGERQVSDSTLLGKKIIFTTLLPSDDECKPGGSSWYMVLDISTGTSLISGTVEDNLETEYINESSDTSEKTSNDKVDKIIVATTTRVDENGNTHVYMTLDDGTVVEDIIINNSPILGRLSWRQLY